MSTSNNKRIVTKSTNKNTINKKVATGDANVESSKPNESMSLKTKEIKAEISKKEEELSPKEKLLKETATLEQKLKDLQKEYKKFEKKKEGEIAKINNLNTEIDEKVKIIQGHGKENVKLMKDLKGLEETLNKKYSKMMDSKLLKKRNKVVNNEAIIAKDIEIHKKEIKIMEKEIEFEKKQQKKLKKRVEGKDAKLEELNKLNNEIEALELELKKLSEIKKEHLNCEKNIQKKKAEVNIKMNEYQLQLKKMIWKK